MLLLYDCQIEVIFFLLSILFWYKIGGNFKVLLRVRDWIKFMKMIGCYNIFYERFVIRYDDNIIFLEFYAYIYWNRVASLIIVVKLYLWVKVISWNAY